MVNNGRDAGKKKNCYHSGANGTLTPIAAAAARIYMNVIRKNRLRQSRTRRSFETLVGLAPPPVQAETRLVGALDGGQTDDIPESTMVTISQKRN